MTPERGQRWHPVTLLLVVPILALLSSVYLPFVNSQSLWFGVPAIFVWTSVWVILITPTLWLVERVLHGPGADDAAPVPAASLPAEEDAQ